MAAAPADVSALPAPVRGALRRHVLTLADSKRLLGLRYSDWLLGAPSIETAIAASSLAQDEWGHARLLYAMLKELGEDPESLERERPAEAYASVDALDRPAADWASLVATMVVVDEAVTAALEAFQAGDFEPATSRIPKMLAEEAFHRDMGRAWFGALADGTEEARELLARACRALLPRTLAWLGPGDEPYRLLVEAGLIGRGTLATDRYQSRLAPLLLEVGVDLAAVSPDHGEWDAIRGRGPGQPDEDAVERARGDRNRALFVE